MDHVYQPHTPAYPDTDTPALPVKSVLAGGHPRFAGADDGVRVVRPMAWRRPRSWRRNVRRMTDAVASCWVADSYCKGHDTRAPDRMQRHQRPQRRTRGAPRPQPTRPHDTPPTLPVRLHPPARPGQGRRWSGTPPLPRVPPQGAPGRPDAIGPAETPRGYADGDADPEPPDLAARAVASPPAPGEDLMTDDDRALLARVQRLPVYPFRPRWTDALMDYEDPTIVWMYWKTGGSETGSPVHHYGQA